MFTGLVRDLGTVERIDTNGDVRRISVRCNLDMTQVQIGASIACDGCCMTVVEKKPSLFVVEAGAETLEKTTLAHWAEGGKVNLEPSLKMGDELGGHIVTGHVDATGKLESIEKKDGSYIMIFSFPDELKGFITSKGSVTVNGISLTVNDVDHHRFSVCIIPHTWQVTNIGTLKEKDMVNLEVDLLARYVKNILSTSENREQQAA